MAKLLVQESNGAREFELVDLEVNIGRELDNTLRLSDPSISRHHAVVRRVDGGYEIQDLDSSNGVLVNGTKVTTAALQDGDRLTLGQMQLTFVDPHPVAPAGGPAGTVRMSPEVMDQLRAATLDPAPVATDTGQATVEGPFPDLAPHRPGPAFLHPWLPGIPDPALPLRSADGGLERGEFRSRFLAGLIDVSPMVALGILALVFAQRLGCLFEMLQLALMIAYLVLLPRCWMHFGATPGKKIMKLRVVAENSTQHLDLNAAVLRLLGYLTNGVISWVIMLPVAQVLMAAFGPSHLLGLAALKAASLAAAVLPYLLILGAERKGLADRFSHSIVIKVDR
jgi:uncharacterized RDD family membrane protein YckC